MEALATLGAAGAWFGASLLVLAEARRGLALSLALTAIGLATVAGVQRGPWPAVAILAGGLASAGLRLRDRGTGWGLLPPGSTPRLLLALGVLLLSLLVGASMMTGPGAAGRVAALAVSGLAGARLLTTGHRAAALSAATAAALAMGLAGTDEAAWGAAVVAVGLGALGAEEGAEAVA